MTEGTVYFYTFSPFTDESEDCERDSKLTWHMNISSLELWVPALWFDLLSPWCQAWVSYTPSPAQKSSSSETLCTHLWHTQMTHVSWHTTRVKYPAVVWKENGLKQISWKGRYNWQGKKNHVRNRQNGWWKAKLLTKKQSEKNMKRMEWQKILQNSMACMLCMLLFKMFGVSKTPPCYLARTHLINLKC